MAEITGESQRVRIDLRRTACVVVDMQNDFCAPGGWLDHIGIDIAPARRPIAPLQRILARLRQTRVPVIWLNWGNRPDRLNLSPSLLHVYKPNGRGVGLGDPLPKSGARVLEKGSWAADIVDELRPETGDIRVDKYRMSGFWDTPLDSILRNLGITTVLFAGVNLDQCVMCTLQDANFLCYDCILIEDCAATTSPDFCRQATLYNAVLRVSRRLRGAGRGVGGGSSLIAKTREAYRAYRISPGDTNRLVLVFDPVGEQANFVFAIEIFDVGGRTPPNVHSDAHEMFYALFGEGVAHADGKSVPFKRGDSLLLSPGTRHVIENTGTTRLYCLTVMVPNQDFAELIRAGEPAALDDEDCAVLLGPQRR